MSNYYHVLNRGVEKRDIVKNNKDRLRFVHNLYVMNDRATVAHPKEIQRERKRDLLVYIHAWCLMDNHYHLLLSPVDDDLSNLSLFMKKLNMGYAKYFNQKYDRTGYLWQGKYKKIEVSTDSHFLYLPYYIHLNPLDNISKQWRKGTLLEVSTSLKFLETYRWSSYLDYCGKQNFPSLLINKLTGNGLNSAMKQKNEISGIIASNGLSLGHIQLESDET